MVNIITNCLATRRLMRGRRTKLRPRVWWRNGSRSCDPGRRSSTRAWAWKRWQIPGPDGRAYMHKLDGCGSDFTRNGRRSRVVGEVLDKEQCPSYLALQTAAIETNQDQSSYRRLVFFQHSLGIFQSVVAIDV